MSFFGTHTLQLDDKNRMRIPAKFRTKLGANFHIFQGIAGSLFVMTEEAFEKFIEPFKSIPISDLEGQAAVRAILATVEVPEEDAQGRFVLPAPLKQCAEIDRRVVFVGINDRIEIWSEENYLAKNIGEKDTINRAMESLKKYGI